MQNVNFNDAFPSYLAPIFIINSTQWVIVTIFIVLFFLAFWIYIQYLKIKTQLNAGYTFLEIRPTADAVKSAFSTKQFFSVLHSVCEPLPLFGSFVNIKRTISCELVSTKEDGIRYILRVPTEDTSVIRKQLLAYLTGIEIRKMGDYLPEKQKDITIRELKLTKKYIYPLQEQSALQEYDPIAYITAPMTKLEKDELVALHVICTPVTDATHSSVLSYTDRLNRFLLQNKDLSAELNRNIAHDIVAFIMDWISLPKEKRITSAGMFQQQVHKDIGSKIAQPLFEVTLRLVIVSKDKANVKSRMKGLRSSLDTFSTLHQRLRIRQPFLSVFAPKIAEWYLQLKLKKRLLSFSGNPILSVTELTSLYHLPYTATTKTEDLVQNKSPKLPSPLSFKKSKNAFDIVFAHNTYGETTTDIGLTIEERRRHIYMIGATGMGKTTLLLQMIWQDICNNKGVAVLDPHGDLSERLLGVIPKNRQKDVVYFNPYDMDYPIGLNVLEMPDGLSASEAVREKDLVVSSLISIFHKLYPARYSGPRMEHVLRNTVLTALETKNPTLFTVYKLLTNATYRRSVTGKLTDPLLKDFWKYEFAKLGSYQQSDLISPITNKLGRFLTTAMTRNVLIQEKSKLDFTDIMNTGKILICDLSKGKIGEDTSSFLGSLIIAKIQLAALKRVHIPLTKRKDFFLYIDEFQNFATMPFAQILSEARKYRLNTILAHQTISQIEDKDLLKVILANTGTVISFRTSNPSDENAILPIFAPEVEKNRIANLPAYHFYIKINELDPQDTFTGTTDDFTEPENVISRDKVIEHSRRMYGLKVEKKVSEETKIPEHTNEVDTIVQTI